jgi:translation initiation factor IF-2
MNTGKVRIYDLSKELNLENKDILAICSNLDIAVKSHSSTISDAEAVAIRSAAQAYSPASSKPQPARKDVEPKNNATPSHPAPPKKQQILQVRRTPDKPELADKPELTAPTANGVVKGSPARPAEPAKAPAQVKPQAETAPSQSGAPATAGAPTATIVAPSVKPEESLSEASKAQTIAPKPQISPKPDTPNNGSSNGGNKNASGGNNGSNNNGSTNNNGAAKSPPPKPSLNKPIPKPVKPPAPVSSPKPAPSGNNARPARPSADKPAAAPQRPQQIVELRRPKPVAPGATEEPRAPGEASGRPVLKANRPVRPADGAAGDKKDSTTPTVELLTKPTLPSRGRKKAWEEEEEAENADKVKAAAAKKRRGPKIQEDDDDDDLDADLEDDDGIVSREQIGLSLARPSKPKSSQPTSKPASTPSAQKRRGLSTRDRRDRRQQQNNQKADKPEIITLLGSVTVQELAQIMVVSETEIIRNLFMKGIAATVTQTLDLATATMVAEEMGLLVDQAKKESEAKKVTEMVSAEDSGNLHRRPPVVTIMGHVDHGKTTLLDSIRKTKVASGEAGGITQHIGAYHVDVEHNGVTQQVVFLDTPGHEAFTAMRARGARVTDIAILVVAADDGVRPQTIEAISHAKAAGVPIIVAINKIDKEAAQPDRVKQELAQYELVPEEWGGSTVMVPVSAQQGTNLDTLLEMILLVSEVEDLTANPDRMAKGTVIEAHLDKAKGSVATLLVQNGTLNVGDILVAGSVMGKVRAMMDDRNRRVKIASPSFAVEVLGLNEVPAAGDEFEVYEDEKSARAVADVRANAQRQSRLMAAMSSRRVSLNTLSSKAQEGELKELNIVMKADVQGSIEAILGSLKQLPQAEVQVRVLFAAPGEISETDVDLASASEAVLIGFNTTLATGARQAADRASVDVREYNIIYNLLDDIQAAMEGLLEPELVEEHLGFTEVRAVFSIGKGAVAGCYIQSGQATRNCKMRVKRGNSIIFEGVLDSLKRMKEDAREVKAGYECGMSSDDFNAWKEGDIIETYKMVTKRRTLSK